jgi:hypothetical protein
MIDSLLSFSVVFWLLTGYCHEGFFVQVAIDLRIIAYFSDILLHKITSYIAKNFNLDFWLNS